MVRGSGSLGVNEDVPWISEDPISGTVSTGHSHSVNVVFDATGLALGEHTANLIVNSNDPDEDPVTVPVTMHVTDTNTPPTLSGVPDQVFDHSTSPPGTIDLWSYASDTESAPGELTYTVEGPPPAGAGVWLEDNRYVRVDPSPNWCGGTDVTIRCTDPGGLWDEDAFRVAVSWSCPGPMEMPGAPVLIAPVDGRTAHSERPTLAWHPVEGAEAYRVQVDDDARFRSPEVDEVIEGTEYVPTWELSDATYRWRVRALNESEVGDWSEGWAFTLPTASPPQRRLYLPVVVRGCP